MNNNYLVLGIAIFLIITSGLGYYLTENGSIFGKGNINITDMANRTLTISSPVSSDTNNRSYYDDVGLYVGSE